MTRARAHSRSVPRSDVAGRGGPRARSRRAPGQGRLETRRAQRRLLVHRFHRGLRQESEEVELNETLQERQVLEGPPGQIDGSRGEPESQRDDGRSARESVRAALQDRVGHRVALGRCARECARCGTDRGRWVRAAVDQRQHVAELTDAELLEQERGHARRSAAAVDRVRDRPQRFETAPDRRSLVADEIPPTTGAIFFPLLVAAVRDRAGAGDEDDAAARRIPRVECGDRVVRHEQLGAGRRELREDLAAACALRLAIAARAREHDGIGRAPAQRLRESRRDRALRIGRGEQIAATARAPAHDGAGLVDRERACLRGTGVDAHDDAVHGRCTAPPRTASRAPVALGSTLNSSRRRYAPMIAKPIASRAFDGTPSSSVFTTRRGVTALASESISAAFREPPPATASIFHVVPGGVSRLSESAMVRVVTASAVASASSSDPPSAVTRSARRVANGLPNSSRPVLLGARRAKYGCASASARARSLTRPERARRPSRSKDAPDGAMIASLGMFAGPVSNAITSSLDAVGMRVRFAMPPRLSTAIGARAEKRTWSPNGTSGAPSPPAAMSALRKSSTVVTPVARATRDASPSCRVVCSAGRCATVWPWSAMTSGRAGRPAMKSDAAAAYASPRDA